MSYLQSAGLILTISILVASRNVLAMSTAKIIDSHAHLWATADESTFFPYLSTHPPVNLQNSASAEVLLEEMNNLGVAGALIVQPINHKFDHSYVAEAIQKNPDRFKGMLLHDPSTDSAQAIAILESAVKQGFVAVRFNPYLWPEVGEKKWALMSDGAGLAVYRRCGELKIPVGVMCFQGLSLHCGDVKALLETSPETIMLLDHFGFCKLGDDVAFEQLLSLATYPQLIVKISALFRQNDTSPYERVRQERFLPLLQAFGADRLMVGSDFPYATEQPLGYGLVDLVSSWIGDDQDRKHIMGGTAERVFGVWGVGSGSIVYR